MDVVVCAARALRIVLPGGGDPPKPRPDLPAVLPRQQRPVNRVPSTPVGRWSSAAPVKFLVADRVSEKYSRGKEEK
jgi:hypothetical protein